MSRLILPNLYRAHRWTDENGNVRVMRGWDQTTAAFINRLKERGIKVVSVTVEHKED